MSQEKNSHGLSATDPNRASLQDKLAIALKRRARFDDEVAQSVTKLQKRQARAHFVLGELILADSKLYEVIRPQLEEHLSQLGAARRFIDEYGANRALLEEFRKLQG